MSKRSAVKRMRTRSPPASVDLLQDIMSTLPQLDLSKATRHHFADGLYCRELARPKGCTIVGKVHKREHLYIVLSGEVTVVSDGHSERIKAPRIIVSRPGTKRAVYAHEDSVCITVHHNPTNTRDLAAIELELVEQDERALHGPGNVLKALA